VTAAVVPQVAMFGGMMGAHELEGRLGLRTVRVGETAVSDVLGSMVGMQVGLAIGTKFMGREWANWRREMEARTEYGAKPGETQEKSPLSFAHALPPPGPLLTKEGGNIFPNAGLPKPFLMASEGASRGVKTDPVTEATERLAEDLDLFARGELPYLNDKINLQDALRVACLVDSAGRVIFRDANIAGYQGGISGIADLLKTGCDLDEVVRLVTQVTFDDGKSVFHTPRDIIRFVESGGDVDYARRVLALRDNAGTPIFGEYSLGLAKEANLSVEQLKVLTDFRDTEGNTVFSRGLDIYEIFEVQRLPLVEALLELKDTEDRSVFRDGSDINRFFDSGGSLEEAARYAAISAKSRPAFNGHEIAVLKAHAVPPAYAQAMAALGLNADTIGYYFKLGLSAENIYFKGNHKPKALVFLPTDNPPDLLGSGAFDEERAIGVLGIVKDHYDIQLRAVSTVEEMYAYLDANPDIALLIWAGHGFRDRLVFGCNNPKYGINHPEHSRMLRIGRADLAEHLQGLSQDAVIFLDSCFNGEGRETGHNLANFVASSAPGRRVISAIEEFNAGDIHFNSFLPFDIAIKKYGIRDLTYIPDNGTPPLATVLPHVDIAVQPRLLRKDARRKKLGKMLSEAHSAMGFFKSSQPNELIDRIVETFGMEVIERRDYCDDFNIGYDCNAYVFHTVLRQPWAANGKATIALTWRPDEPSPLAFLYAKGFRAVDEPQEGDLVAYVGLEHIHYPKYFGVYSQGKVLSKLDFGHVVRHDLKWVPEEFSSAPPEGLIYLRLG
jgi:hypothetical protein